MNFTYKIIIPIKFFRIDKPVDISLGFGFKIISGMEVYPKLNKKFTDYLGSYNIDLIRNNHCFYTEIKLPFDPELTAGKLAHRMSNHISKFVDSLWLIRDNSCSINDCFVQCIELDQPGLGGKIGINCDSTDLLSVTTFTAKEINNHKATVYPTFKKHLESLDQPALQPEMPKNKQITYLTPKLNYISYSAPRLSRALLFLSSLRKNAFMITKITFYMAIFETLFTTSNIDVTEKIAQRASSFVIDKPEDEKRLKDYYSLIKDAYNVRSRYMHGDPVDYSREALMNISKSIDDLTRKILLKIFNSADNSLFTTPDTKKQTAIKKYYKELTQKHYPPIVETGNEEAQRAPYL